MGMTTVYVAERAMPRRPVRDVKVEGVRTVGELFQRLFA
jgi:hypothetical protein